MYRKLIALALLLTACSTPPKPVYHLIPESEKSAWLYGQQFVHLDSGHIDIAFAFDRVEDQNFVFDVEIANLTEDMLLVSPEDFYYKPYYLPEKIIEHPILSVNSLHDSCLAIDPEKMIIRNELKLAQAEARFKTKEDQLAGLSFLDLLFDIATIAQPKTDAEIDEEEREDLERKLESVENELKYSLSVKSINTLKDKWRDIALRKTTLNPGYSVTGKVYFPINYVNIKGKRQTDKLLFHFQIGKQIFRQIFNINTYTTALLKQK